ncbi:SDR family oxidoreductase [Candidatus Micrarchaeota archaeon]|nr:SDR family oxidoreductase [Candidatus Micrarchaeota archaeon]
MPLNCLVTGGGKGIGRAIALEFAKHGCSVAINYFHSEIEAKKTLEDLRALADEGRGIKAIALKADVSDEASVENMVAQVWNELEPLDFLVNNAGIYAQNPGTPFYELPRGDWDEVMAVNATGAFLVSKHVAKRMIAGNVRGSIVNISSISGLDASRAGAHYGASKAAVIALTKSMCADLGRFGIRVNSIAPGAVPKTGLLAKVPDEKNEVMRLQTPLQRLSSVDDVAKAAYALANMPNVSGQTIVVDGGRLKH